MSRNRVLGRIAIGVLALVAVPAAALLGYFAIVYGGGKPYPDVTGVPLLPDAALEAAVVSEGAIGNAAVDRSGRVFYTIHPESHPTGPRLWVKENGTARPFPDAERQTTLFATPLGLCVDSKDRLWVVDPGDHGSNGPRLIALDTATGAVLVEHRFPDEIAPLGSFLQDLRTDPAAETVYIADVSFWRREPAIVVHDIASGTSRRVLQRHPSVVSQNLLIRTAIKDMSFIGGILQLKTGIDGIAVDPTGQWVYWAAMNHDGLYRAPAAALRDPALDDAALSKLVERVGTKPLSDGISVDLEGGVLVTDVEHGAVVRIAPDGTLTTLVKDPRIRWADAVNFGPDGAVYLSDSAIPHLMLQSQGHIRAHAPYTIWRFTPPVAGVPGQ